MDTFSFAAPLTGCGGRVDSLFYALQYHDLDRRSNKMKGFVGWLVGDLGDVSDGQNDTLKQKRKKYDNGLSKYLQETVNKKF
ncbi:MAG: hypothetical protein WCF23_24510 [Candidatus Nitrosopolaris sp.]